MDSDAHDPPEKSPNIQGFAKRATKVLNVSRLSPIVNIKCQDFVRI